MHRRTTVLQSVAEAVFIAALVPLWPVLRAWAHFFPVPYPPQLAPLLEGPLRRLLQNRDRTLAASGIGPGEWVLEIGPGGGYVTEGILERLGTDGRLVCLDLQVAMLHHVHARFGARAPALVCASGSVLPFRAGSFHRVILVGVLGEIPDEAGALRECRRVLRPGGTLAVTEAFPDPDYVRAPVLERQAREAGFTLGERTATMLGYTQQLHAG